MKTTLFLSVSLVAVALGGCSSSSSGSGNGSAADTVLGPDSGSSSACVAQSGSCVAALAGNGAGCPGGEAPSSDSTLCEGDINGGICCLPIDAGGPSACVAQSGTCIASIAEDGSGCPSGDSASGDPTLCEGDPNGGICCLPSDGGSVSTCVAQGGACIAALAGNGAGCPSDDSPSTDSSLCQGDPNGGICCLP